MAKAAYWRSIDAQARKHGDQTGLDTLVVHALNDVHLMSALRVGVEANAISEPPGEYARKGETQRN